MQKIMFNDRYGLTQAVLEGRKIMTRRMAPYPPFDEFLHLNPQALLSQSRYKIGEVIAVAQSYNDVYHLVNDTIKHVVDKIDCNNKGWSNKMFVKADLMPHQIKITNIEVERLQDISNDSALKEGIRERYSHKVGMNVYDFANCKKAHHTPRHAFADLIDKVSGKGTWNNNPWVFAYSFELIK